MALRELLALFRVHTDTKSLATADRALDASKSKAEGLFAALGGLRDGFLALGAALGVAQAWSFTQATIEAADAVGDTAAAVNLSTDAYQTWSTWAELAGGSADGLTVAVRTLAKQAASAAEGGGAAAATFKALGVELRDGSGNLKETDALLADTVVGLAGMSDRTKQLALAQELLGRSGMTFLGGIRQGPEAAQALIDKARELGPAFNEAFVSAAGEANDQLMLFHKSTLRLRSVLVGFFLPTITATADWLTRAALGASEFLEPITRIRAALAAAGLGGAAALLRMMLERFGGIGGAVKALLPWASRLLGAFMRFAIPFLLFEDFFVFMRGGKSVIGDALKELGLVDDPVKAAKDLRKAWEDFRPTALAAAQAVARFFAETLIGLGALWGMWTETDAKIQGSFESVFMRNTNTIGRFFGTVFEWLWSWTRVFQYVATQTGLILGAELARQLMIWRAFGAWVVKAAQDFWAGVIAVTLGCFQAIDSLLGTYLVGSVAAALGTISNLFASTWTGVEQGFMRIMRKVTTKALQLAGIMQDFGNDPIGTLTDIKGRVAALLSDTDASDAQNAAYARQLAGNAGVVIPAPTAPEPRYHPRGAFGQKAAGQVSADNRTIVVNVNGGDSPAATGRAVAGAVESVSLSPGPGAVLSAVE